MKPEISIILPTYNEAENICPLIDRILNCLSPPFEIIVIDDNSPDGTAGHVAAVYGENPLIRLFIRKNERGLTSAIRRGIQEARGDILVWMDCDLSMAPEKIPELVYQIKEKGFDVAVGSRYVPGGADTRTDSGKIMLFIHKMLSRLITWFTAVLLWPGFLDWTSGFIAVRSSVIKKFQLTGDYGEYFIDMMYRLLREGYKVTEVPYNLTPRTRGESKTATNVLGFFTKGIKYVHFILRLKFINKV